MQSALHRWIIPGKEVPGIVGMELANGMKKPGKLNRRQFIKGVAAGTILPGMFAGSLMGGYALYEAKHCGVYRTDIALRNLPAPFDGMTIAFLADSHHGPLNPLEYLERVVIMTNALRPDMVALGGDYVQHGYAFEGRGSHRHYVWPGIEVLSRLRAPLGCFAVLGNHDYMVDPTETRRALAAHDITDLTNTGVWLERGGARLRFGGVDDCRLGSPLLAPAVGDMTGEDAAVIMTHNPDFVELIRDKRVDLVLSGHTHGGQVVLPFVGAPITSSWYGQKYVQGLRQGPSARVFVTRGVGTTGLPIRFACPPEVALLTLRRHLVT